MVREAFQFRWTDEGEVTWVEEEDQPFAFIVRQTNGGEVAFARLVGFDLREIWSFGTNLNHNRDVK